MCHRGRGDWMVAVEYITHALGSVGQLQQHIYDISDVESDYSSWH